MDRDEVGGTMHCVFKECFQLFDDGQKEYARENENAFANFERVADSLDIDRKEVLLVYALKHMDGITSFVQGHKSQREDVRGRINDLIVYLCILRGMIDEEEDGGTEEWADLIWPPTSGWTYTTSGAQG